MKAEEILKLIERAGMPDLKIAHIKEYARIQIEKDREIIKEKINSNIGDYKKYLNPCKYIDETPIILE